MLLLKYDTRHIRAFKYKQPFIKFSHFEDSLLSIAPILFASSTSIKITSSQIRQCTHLNSILESPPHKMIITYKDNRLQIEYSKPNGEKIKTVLSYTHFNQWEKLFIELTKNFALAQYYKISHQSKSILEKFFNELTIPLPSQIERLIITYTDQFFFIPFEFLYDYFYCSIIIPSKNSLHSKEIIDKIAIMYDPNLEMAQEESLYIFKLLEKRGFQFNNTQASIALISSHGIITNNQSCLQNHILQEIIIKLSPQLIIFNSCLLAQQPYGIIQYYLDKGCIVIASPFFTLCTKTIFSPLLRFLTDTSPKSIGTAFYLLKIFYPNIYQYFRIYFPKNHPR